MCVGPFVCLRSHPQGNTCYLGVPNIFVYLLVCVCERERDRDREYACVLNMFTSCLLLIIFEIMKRLWKTDRLCVCASARFCLCVCVYACAWAWERYAKSLCSSDTLYLPKCHLLSNWETHLIFRAFNLTRFSYLECFIVIKAMHLMCAYWGWASFGFFLMPVLKAYF